MDTSLLDGAVVFATHAHSGAERRGKGFPYLVHLLETVSIVATISPDQELLAAAVLHDVLEDTETTEGELRSRFGSRVADLVVSESEPTVAGKRAEASWHERKQAAIDRLAASSRDAKTVALGDKLSNMRAIASDYDELGDAIWQRFHVKERSEHEWHYRGLVGALSELADTTAYQEFVALVEHVWGGGE